MNRRESLRQVMGAAAAMPALMDATAVAGAATSRLADGPDAPARRVDRDLDLVSPAGQLDAFVKIFVSRRADTIWYWYSGVLDAAVLGQPVVPLIGCDTLIRREVLPQSDGPFALRVFESNYFHSIGSNEPLHSFDNPLNGRRVEPLHYREGPHVMLLSTQAPRFFPGAEPPSLQQRAAVLAGNTPLALPWQQSGPLLWTTRESYSDRPHPLDPEEWRLESSGARNASGSFANYVADAAAVASRRTFNVDCSFSYQAIFGWWPWLLMGQTPGQLLWRAQGRKLRALDELPAGAREGFKAVHPRMFANGLPWLESASMWSEFIRDRRPVAP